MTGIWLISYITLWILFVLLAVVVLLLLRSLSVVVETVNAVHHGSDEAPTTLAVGEPLPDVVVQTRDGTPASLHSLGGMATALVVVSSGCEPCREVIAEISHAPSSSDPLDLQVSRTVLIWLGAVQEVDHDVTTAQIPATLPVLIDSGQEVRTRWGIRGTPTTVIVDANWQVVRASTGFLSRTTRESVRSA